MASLKLRIENAAELSAFLTARDRYRRIRAYARASKREDDARLAVVRGDRGAAWRNLPQLVDNASEAWSRLPDVARRAILDPREVQP